MQAKRKEMSKQLAGYIAAGLAVFFSSSSFAVYHQNVSVANDDGKPVQSATVSLTIPGQPTVTATDNGEGDDDDRVGFFKLSLKDDAVGKTGTLKVTSNGKTTTQKVTIGKTIAVALATPAASTAARSARPEITIDISRTFGDLETSHNSPFFNGSGSDVGARQNSFGADFRFPMADDLFYGAQARAFFGGSNQGLNIIQHPSIGTDTSILIEDNFAAMLYAGMMVAAIQEYQLSLILGARATRTLVEGVVDERGGSGERERFTDHEWRIQPSLLLEVTGPTCRVLGARWRAGVAFDRAAEHDVNGVSSTFPFAYSFETDDAWQARTFFGVIM